MVLAWSVKGVGCRGNWVPWFEVLSTGWVEERDISGSCAFTGASASDLEGGGERREWVEPMDWGFTRGVGEEERERGRGYMEDGD
jgi:hypothetical protein